MDRTFDTWQYAVRVHLARHDIDDATADRLIEEAREHWSGSGLDPWEANDEPRAFARSAAQAQPIEEQAVADTRRAGVGSSLEAVGFAVPVLAMPLTILGGLLEGEWAFALTPARLIGAALVVLVVAMLFLPDIVRGAGYPRRAPWTLAPFLFVMVLTVLAFSSLPHDELITVPVPVFLALLVALVLVQILPIPWPSLPLARRHGGRPSRETSDPSEWFERLEGLLVGRYNLPRRLAAGMVDEARTHAGPRSPVEEFGQVEVYAAQLASAEPPHEPPWWTTDLMNDLVLIFVAVLARNHIRDWLSNGAVWRLLIACAVVLAIFVTTLTVLVRAFMRWGRARRQEAQAVGQEWPKKPEPTSQAPKRPTTVHPRAAELQAEQGRWPWWNTKWAALPVDSQRKYDEWVLASPGPRAARRRAQAVTRRCYTGRPWAGPVRRLGQGFLDNTREAPHQSGSGDNTMAGL